MPILERLVFLRRRPRPTQTQISEPRRLLVMLTMSLGAFGIGTTEFVSMGLLKLIAEDFRITEDTAGVIITTYALGVVVGAPLITALTGMLPRRRLLLLLMAAFTIGNGLSVLATNYETLLVARFLPGYPTERIFQSLGYQLLLWRRSPSAAEPWRLSEWDYR